MPRIAAVRSTDAVACRVPIHDADLIRTTAHRRGQSVSALLRDLLDAPLGDLRRAA